MKPEPRVPRYQYERPRRNTPTPDSAIRDAAVIAAMIGFLFLVYMYADLVRVTP